MTTPDDERSAGHVRVIDASLATSAGPVRLSLADDRRGRLTAVLDQHGLIDRSADHATDPDDGVASAGRYVGVVATLEELAIALDRGFGASIAGSVMTRIRSAVDNWIVGPGDVELDRGRSLLRTSRRTLIQGVLNVTPDSFSDGGTFLGADGDLSPAIEAGRRMIAQGVDIVDVGGESTRPGASAVPEDLELERTIPVVRALAEQGAIVSIDTTKAAVARAAVEAGASMVNDVSAGAMDQQLIPTVADLGVAYVLMHMRGTPRTMQNHPRYRDVVAEVFDHLASGLDQLNQAGVSMNRVIVDPGIGFGKTIEHNLQLLRRLRELTSLGRPVLIGASRKSFIGHLTSVADPTDRLEGSLAVAALAINNGARIVRVHDVPETMRVVAMADAVRGGAMTGEEGGLG